MPRHYEHCVCRCTRHPDTTLACWFDKYQQKRQQDQCHCVGALMYPVMHHSFSLAAPYCHAIAMWPTIKPVLSMPHLCPISLGGQSLSVTLDSMPSKLTALWDNGWQAYAACKWGEHLCNLDDHVTSTSFTRDMQWQRAAPAMCAAITYLWCTAPQV